VGGCEGVYGVVAGRAIGAARGQGDKIFWWWQHPNLYGAETRTPKHLTRESSRAGAGNTQESGRPSEARSQSAIAISSESEEVGKSESEGKISSVEF
jgi:hypothetical protein